MCYIIPTLIIWYIINKYNCIKKTTPYSIRIQFQLPQTSYIIEVDLFSSKTITPYISFLMKSSNINFSTYIIRYKVPVIHIRFNR